MAQPPSVPLHVQRLIPYSPGKPIEEVKRELGLTDVIKLASNENPLGPSPRALAAMQAAAAHVGLYPDGSCYSLVQALARHWDVPTEYLIAGNGSDEIIHFLGLAYLRPGDEVLSCEPTFVRYQSAAILNQAEYIAPPLRDFRYDLAAMAERLSPRTRMVFIANPNNPTGTIVAAAEMRRFLDLVPESAIVVVDEAYCEYATSPDYPQTWPYVREGRNVVVLRTFSKIYALAGLRVGYGIARPEIIAALHQVREPFNVSSLAQAAAMASLEDREQVERSRRTNREGLVQLTAGFARLGLRWVPSQANFILVDVGRPCVPVFQALLRRGVIVRTGDIFGLPTWLRVTVGTAAENERFLGALSAALADERIAATA
ncbi:MAG: histidinol-phosphate transaminase [Armatimonadetes bacterium]|nr:histidinol-phosphate transaminase [Armatimonadota bacterium]